MEIGCIEDLGDSRDPKALARVLHGCTLRPTPESETVKKRDDK